MNNLSSYCGLVVDAKIRASDKDLPVLINDLQFQSDKDPRQRHVQRPSRLKDVIRLYFQNLEATLPQICPLDFLVSTLVEFCRENHAHITDKDITPQDQAKFNEALKHLAAMDRNRMEEVRLFFSKHFPEIPQDQNECILISNLFVTSKIEFTNLRI